MTTFSVGQSVSTAAPEVLVDAGLAPGRHRFQLVVIDARGRRSQPAEALVQINVRGIGPLGPIGPLRPTIPIGPIPVVPVVPVPGLPGPPG